MPLEARRFIRKMRGGAQAHLLETADGRCYVVKFLNNSQHRRILLNEWIAGAVLRYLQIAVPESAIISIGREFLDANPGVSIESAKGRVPVEPGWHFGSRYPGDPGRTAVYDFLPDALVGQLGNLRDFLGVLVADKWMANADARQAIYFRARWSEYCGSEPAPARAGFLAQMIDHGFTFGGPSWEFHDSPLQGFAMRPAPYQAARTWEDFQPWLDRVRRFPETVIDEARKSVPPQWLEGDRDAMDRLLERLLQRRSRVEDLIRDAIHARPGWFPNWSCRGRRVRA